MRQGSLSIPDLGDPVPAGAIRAAQPGLELMTRDGRWLAVQTPPDVMVCDTGDMMQLLTAGRLPATTHRDVDPEGSDGGRLSMPFFLHPHPDRPLEPMRPGYAPPISGRDFLLRRLREIGFAS